MSKTFCKTLTIFEGPDGSGKTTAAKAYARSIGARYVHFSAMPHVGKDLARMYIEAMLPALLGYQDVVFDRSWLSDGPYGAVHREGKDRIGPVHQCMLERAALRCGAMVVFCDPGVEACLATFRERSADEMLDNEDQLRNVHELYSFARQSTALPFTTYDYTCGLDVEDVLLEIEDIRAYPHSLDVLSAGNLSSRVLIVGQNFAERKDGDSYYQLPFISFNSGGCSRWLTSQLFLRGVKELDLCWVNADQPLEKLEWKGTHIFALGDVAAKIVGSSSMVHKFPHPQYWKRFGGSETYPLIPRLLEVLHD